MTTILRSSLFAVALACGSSAAHSPRPQHPPSTQTPAPASDESTRPATTTFFGDTGIWFVPTGEVLPDGKWSGSVYRRGTNWIQGYTNVADFAGTFAYGLKDRAEIFGSFLVDTRIDRDLRPIFVNDPTFGGIIDRYPQVEQVLDRRQRRRLLPRREDTTSGPSTARSRRRSRVRGIVKLPTGKTDVGVSTGKPDFSFDFIVSKEASKLVEVSGFGGYEFRGSPDGFDTPTGAFRWGTGVALPVAQRPAGLRRVERLRAVERRGHDHRRLARRHRSAAARR